MTNYTHIRLEISGRDAAISEFIEEQLKEKGLIDEAMSIDSAEFDGGQSHTIFFLTEGVYPKEAFQALEMAWPRLEFWAAWWREGDGSGGIGRAGDPVPTLDDERAFNQATGREPLEHRQFCPCCGRE